MKPMKTPGVYIVEKDAFPNSVVQVATAVPAFIGYTEKALEGKKSLHMKPSRITSMAEFHTYFGFAAAPEFDLVPYKEPTGKEVSPLSAAGAMQKDPLAPAVFEVQGPQGVEKYALQQKGDAYALYGAMRLFFQNGGGACYIVSCGEYGEAIDAERMLAGIKTLVKEPEPTMVVIPETTRLVRQNAVKVQQAMLMHCGVDMKNRFAILDIFGGHLPRTPSTDAVATFRNDIGINALNFGAAYYPWVNTSIFQSRDFTFENISPETRGRFIGLLKRSIGGGTGGAGSEINRIGVPEVTGDFTVTLLKGDTVQLTDADIAATDDISDAGKLTFTVKGDAAGMKGELVNSTDPTQVYPVYAEDSIAKEIEKNGKMPVSFTQADLDAGAVSFKHDGSGYDKGAFEVVVTDEHGIAADSKTVAVDVVAAQVDTAALIKGSAIPAIDVLANDAAGADAATVTILGADKTSNGKTKNVADIGVWSVGDDGKITFVPDANFTGPSASIAYTVMVDGEVSNPAEVRVSVAATPEEAAAQPSVEVIDKTLRAIVPLYTDVMNEITKRINTMPPAAGMAGIYTMVDNTRGVWKAPANVSLNSVVSPTVNIDHEDQEDLNVTPQGKSINAIRPFVGEGTLVWGARTLDGNSLDWRYVSVRRTMIMIEESIRLASKAYVFEPNTAQTWTTMKSMIENFLTNVWKAGGLAGATPQDAFSVHVGLGDTMTPVDILEGKLLITVLVAVTRPAEFIEITFMQQMQKS